LQPVTNCARNLLIPIASACLLRLHDMA
jgi:hypothetical protein